MGSDNSGRYPEVTVSGSFYEMGYTHGEICREKIQQFIHLSFKRIEHSSGLTLEEAMERASRYFNHVEDFNPDLIEELRGLADGAKITIQEAMFLQVRTLLMYPPENNCTAFALEPKITAEGTSIIGQNWDWDPDLDNVCLILKRYPKNRPSFICFTQAGLISYIGLSSEGVCICLNLLLAPGSRYGVPVYFLMRSIYEQTSLDDCIRIVKKTRNAMSENMLIGNAQGAVDIEITVNNVKVLRPANSGILIHTNHFLDPILAENDELVKDLPDTISRYKRINQLLDDLVDKPSVAVLKKILADHEGYPSSICRHPNDDPNFGFNGTVCSLIMEPAEGRIHVSHGNPCSNGYDIYKL